MHGLRRRRGEPEPDQPGPQPARRDVGPGDPHAVVGAERHPLVAPAAGVPRRGQPGVAHLEPHAVEQLDRHRPEAAHLAAGVEAGRGVAAVLGAHLVEPAAHHQAAAVREPRAGGQLRRAVRPRLGVVPRLLGRRRGRREQTERHDQGGGEQGGDEGRTAHGSLLIGDDGVAGVTHPTLIPPGMQPLVSFAKDEPHGLPTPRAHRLRRLEPDPRHHDVRQGDRRARCPRAARRLRRGRRQPRRHRRRLQRRRLGGDHRPLARRPARRRAGRHRAGDQGPVPDRRRGQRHRALAAAPAARPRRVAAPARGRLRRPLPGALLGPGDPARGDAGDARRPGAGRQGPLRRPLELHRLAGPEDGGAGDRARLGLPRDAAAAVQPAGPRARVGDRAVVPRRRARTAALVAARWWLADRQVHQGRATHRRDPARRGPGPRRRGLRASLHRSSAPGTSSTPSARSRSSAA